MSRTRIVKGNITKITGGNYIIRSKGTIENIGSKVIQVGKEGVFYGKPEFDKIAKKAEEKKPKLLELHMEDLEHNVIDVADIKVGQEVYLVITSKKTNGITADINITNKAVDFKYKGEWMKDDIIKSVMLNEETTHVKLEVVKQRNRTA